MQSWRRKGVFVTASGAFGPSVPPPPPPWLPQAAPMPEEPAGPAAVWVQNAGVRQLRGTRWSGWQRVSGTGVLFDPGQTGQTNRLGLGRFCAVMLLALLRSFPSWRA